MIINVMGIPGSGKSTLIRGLAERLEGSLAWYEEPDDYPLVSFVSTRSPERQFLNQLSFQIRKVELAHRLEAMGDRVHLVELDWVSSHHLWSMGLSRAGLLGDAGRAALDEVYRAAQAAALPQADLNVVLEADPRIVRERLLIRGRAFEAEGDFWDLCGHLASVLPQVPARPELLILGRLRASDAVQAVIDALSQEESER